MLGFGERVEVDIVNLDMKYKKDIGKVDRLVRVVFLGLDEFRNKVFNFRSKYMFGVIGSVIYRVEFGGVEYNYVFFLKGVKVLDFNKEVKGVFNILSKDKDKYFRNLCLVEEKFVVIEFLEEILVDIIEIVNFEYYFLNLKDFDILGSLVYFIEIWVKLGNFLVVNVKYV